MKKDCTVLTILVCLFAVLCTASDSRPDEHYYERFDKVDTIVDRIWPKGNPSETYNYYYLPFCPLSEDAEVSQDLGADVTGSRKVKVNYDLRFLVQNEHQVLCSQKLSRSDVAKFREAVKRDFHFLMYYDGMPLVIPVGEVKDGKSYLFTHLNFHVRYNGNRIIQVTASPDPNRKVDISGNKELAVEFSYSAFWQQTQQTFEQRVSKYDAMKMFPEEIEIQWFSIVNSLILVVVLTSFLAIIMMRILKRDYEAYNREEEDGVDKEESGWKLLHGDVFRFPRHINLLSALLGNGVQLLSLAFSVLFLALVGAFYADIGYRAMYTAIIVIYALTTGISGYVSAAFYKQMGGENWVRNVFLTVFLFAGPVFITWAFCNTVALVYQSSAAFPFKTIAGILALYFLVSFPLQLIGAITAKNFAYPFDAPTRAKKVPREIPPTVWYKSGPIQVLVAGFLPFSAIYIELYYVFISMWSLTMYTPYPILFLVFVILVMVTSCITIAMTYLQLSQEDHLWWWRAVLCGGASSFFIFGYAIYYFLFESQMTGFLQMAFYFGYNICICYGFFLMMASVGFFSSLTFVRQIFRSIKCD
jgi:hypothetical protein